MFPFSSPLEQVGEAQQTSNMSDWSLLQQNPSETRRNLFAHGGVQQNLNVQLNRNPFGHGSVQSEQNLSVEMPRNPFGHGRTQPEMTSGTKRYTFVDGDSAQSHLHKPQSTTGGNGYPQLIWQNHSQLPSFPAPQALNAGLGSINPQAYTSPYVVNDQGNHNLGLGISGIQSTPHQAVQFGGRNACGQFQAYGAPAPISSLSSFGASAPASSLSSFGQPAPTSFSSPFEGAAPVLFPPPSGGLAPVSNTYPGSSNGMPGNGYQLTYPIPAHSDQNFPGMNPESSPTGWPHGILRRHFDTEPDLLGPCTNVEQSFADQGEYTPANVGSRKRRKYKAQLGLPKPVDVPYRYFCLEEGCPKVYMYLHHLKTHAESNGHKVPTGADFENVRKAPGYKDPRSAYMKAYHARRVADGTSKTLIAKKPRASRKTPVATATLPPMPAPYSIPPNKAQRTSYISGQRTSLASTNIAEESLNDRHDPHFSARHLQDFDMNEFQFGSMNDDEDEAQLDNQYGEHRVEPDNEDMGDHDPHHEARHDSDQDADHESVEDDDMY